MASNSFESVLAHLPGLNEDQRRQLEQLFATWPPPPAGAPPEEQLDYRLATRGLLRRIPRFAPDAPGGRGWAPVAISGPPLSRTIIEERR